MYPVEYRSACHQARRGRGPTIAAAGLAARTLTTAPVSSRSHAGIQPPPVLARTRGSAATGVWVTSAPLLMPGSAGGVGVDSAGRPRVRAHMPFRTVRQYRAAWLLRRRTPRR